MKIDVTAKTNFIVLYFVLLFLPRKQSQKDEVGSEEGFLFFGLHKVLTFQCDKTEMVKMVKMVKSTSFF